MHRRNEYFWYLLYFLRSLLTKIKYGYRFEALIMRLSHFVYFFVYFVFKWSWILFGNKYLLFLIYRILLIMEDMRWRVPLGIIFLFLILDCHCQRLHSFFTFFFFCWLLFVAIYEAENKKKILNFMNFLKVLKQLQKGVLLLLLPMLSGNIAFWILMGHLKFKSEYMLCCAIA